MVIFRTAVKGARNLANRSLFKYVFPVSNAIQTERCLQLFETCRFFICCWYVFVILTSDHCRYHVVPFKTSRSWLREGAGRPALGSVGHASFYHHLLADECCHRARRLGFGSGFMSAASVPHVSQNCQRLPEDMRTKSSERRP